MKSLILSLLALIVTSTAHAQSKHDKFLKAQLEVKAAEELRQRIILIAIQLAKLSTEHQLTESFYTENSKSTNDDILVNETEWKDWIHKNPTQLRDPEKVKFGYTNRKDGSPCEMTMKATTTWDNNNIFYNTLYHLSAVCIVNKTPIYYNAVETTFKNHDFYNMSCSDLVNYTNTHPFQHHFKTAPRSCHVP